MNAGQIVFAQLMQHLPLRSFHTCVCRYDGDHGTRTFSCLDQFRAMAFAQLAFRESLRDIEASLQAAPCRLYHMGFRCRAVPRATLADANERRDWRIFADFTQRLIAQARPLYAGEDLGLDLDNTVYALDSTTIDLCLSIFPWARFRRHKAAVKLHTLLNLRGAIPEFVHVSQGKTHDVTAMDLVIPQPGAYYVFDRAYLDFLRLYRFHCSKAFFVTRSLKRHQFQRRCSHAVEKSTGLRSDQTIVLTGPKSMHRYPEPLRRIVYVEAEHDNRLVFLTNDFDLPALTIAALYKARWQIELFFKWIKQHLRIKAFYGTSLNAVTTQVWTAVATYVLVALVKKRLGLTQSLYTILQILNLVLYEKMPILQVFSKVPDTSDEPDACNQLKLFDF